MRQVVMSLPAHAGDVGSVSGSGNPLSGKWRLTPVFLPEKFNGQEILMGYYPWGCKESNTTEHTRLFEISFLILA